MSGHSLGILLYLMMVAMPAGWLHVLVGLIGAGTSGAQIVVCAYCGQYDSMAIRSTGVGFAAGVDRLGAIICVPLNLPLQQNFLVIGAFGIVGAIALVFINDRHSAIADEEREEHQKAAPQWGGGTGAQPRHVQRLSSRRCRITRPGRAHRRRGCFFGWPGPLVR